MNRYESLMEHHPIGANITSRSVVAMAELVCKVEEIALNFNERYTHLTEDTLEQQYNDVMLSVVFDMTVMPVHRERLRNIGTYDKEGDDQDDVTEGFSEIIALIATIFDKNASVVKEEMIQLMNDFPIDDARKACTLRCGGMLH